MIGKKIYERMYFEELGIEFFLHIEIFDFEIREVVHG